MKRISSRKSVHEENGKLNVSYQYSYKPLSGGPVEEITVEKKKT